MQTTGIVEAVKMIVEHEMRKLHFLELGEVTSVSPHSSESDKQNYECSIRLRDTQVELKNVPVSTQHIGLANIVHSGDLVLISFINGDFNSPVVIGRLYNDEDRPPLSKMEEIVYQPPYTVNNQLKRLKIVLPQGVVNITLEDNALNVIVGKSSIHANSKGEIMIRSSKSSKSKEGSQIEINNDGITIGSASSASNSRLELKNDGKFAMSSLSGGKNSQITVDGDKLDISSDLPVFVRAPKQTALNLGSGLAVNIASRQEVSVNATGKVSIDGGLVKIN